jgi:hypothetical protein
MTPRVQGQAGVWWGGRARDRVHGAGARALGAPRAPRGGALGGKRQLQLQPHRASRAVRVPRAVRVRGGAGACPPLAKATPRPAPRRSAPNRIRPLCAEGFGIPPPPMRSRRPTSARFPAPLALVLPKWRGCAGRSHASVAARHAAAAARHVARAASPYDLPRTTLVRGGGTDSLRCATAWGESLTVADPGSSGSRPRPGSTPSSGATPS